MPWDLIIFINFNTGIPMKTSGGTSEDKSDKTAKGDQV
jgi:hypothetical protein